MSRDNSATETLLKTPAPSFSLNSPTSPAAPFADHNELFEHWDRFGDRIKRTITRYEKVRVSSSKSIQCKDERIRTLEAENRKLRDEVESLRCKIGEFEAEKAVLKRENGE